MNFGVIAREGSRVESYSFAWYKVDIREKQVYN